MGAPHPIGDAAALPLEGNPLSHRSSRTVYLRFASNERVDLPSLGSVGFFDKGTQVSPSCEPLPLLTLAIPWKSSSSYATSERPRGFPP